MCNPAAMMGIQAIGTIGSAYGANAAGQGQKAYYQYLAAQNQQQIPKVLQTADTNIAAVTSESGREEQNLSRGESVIQGTQKASLAANGVWGGGTADAIARDTASKAALDRAAIRENANIQTRSISMGANNQVTALKGQADQFTMAGDNAAQAGRTNAFTSVLNGATAVAKNWYKWKQTQPDSSEGDPLASVYGNI